MVNLAADSTLVFCVLILVPVTGGENTFAAVGTGDRLEFDQLYGERLC